MKVCSSKTRFVQKSLRAKHIFQLPSNIWSRFFHGSYEQEGQVATDFILFLFPFILCFLDFVFSYNFPLKQAVSVLAANVVDGIALNLFRLQMIGIRHIMVASLVPGTCMPYSTIWVNNSNACITNDTMSSETILNNALLEDRVNLLNKGLHGANIIIVNMTKAFQELFHNGEKYGEVTLTKPLDVCHANFNII